MENKLMIFENETFGKVRTLTIGGEAWFVAADVCKALDLGNPSMTVERLDDDEKGISTIDTLGGKQRMAIINEPGLYSLVLSSRKPEAKAFKRWITHEVLPNIRKHGVYITDEKLKLFAEHPELLDALMKSPTPPMRRTCGTGQSAKRCCPRRTTTTPLWTRMAAPTFAPRQRS